MFMFIAVCKLSRLEIGATTDLERNVRTLARLEQNNTAGTEEIYFI